MAPGLAPSGDKIPPTKITTFPRWGEGKGPDRGPKTPMDNGGNWDNEGGLVASRLLTRSRLECLYAALIHIPNGFFDVTGNQLTTAAATVAAGRQMLAINYTNAADDARFKAFRANELGHINFDDMLHEAENLLVGTSRTVSIYSSDCKGQLIISLCHFCFLFSYNISTSFPTFGTLLSLPYFSKLKILLYFVSVTAASYFSFH